MEGEGRVEGTEMIKGFLFCFENFHYGISLGIEKFGKYKYIVGFHMMSLKYKLKNYRSYRDFTFTMH